MGDESCCAICKKAPRLGGMSKCPWCAYGPTPASWPPFVRRTVELQGGFDLAPGVLPPSDVACSAEERRMQDQGSPFGFWARERFLRSYDRPAEADQVRAAAERAFARPGTWG